MKEFICGALFACLFVIPVVVLLLRRKLMPLHQGGGATAETDAELARLTGELAHEIKNPLSTIKVNLKLTREALDEVGNLDSRKPLSEHHQNQLGSATRKITVVQK